MRQTILRWRPIVVGVDGSPESAGAAVLGWRLAEAAGTTCRLVHAVPDPGTAFAAMVLHGDVETLEEAVARLARPRLRAALEKLLPDPLLDALTIRLGPVARALQNETARLGAGLVILGGKRHPVPERWLAGNSARDAVRTLNVPVLITKGAPSALKRVLLGLDFSYASEPAIREAERFTALADGQMRAMHVREPVTILPSPKARSAPQPANGNTMELLGHEMWRLLRLPDAQRTVRAGNPAAVLAAEAIQWDADVLVVGSHRKSWADRLWLGTVTESLLHRLPVSLLAVPGRARPAGEGPDRHRSRNGGGEQDAGRTSGNTGGPSL